jgi:hypothetical protein
VTVFESDKDPKVWRARAKADEIVETMFVVEPIVKGNTEFHDIPSR